MLRLCLRRRIMPAHPRPRPARPTIGVSAPFDGFTEKPVMAPERALSTYRNPSPLDRSRSTGPRAWTRYCRPRRGELPVRGDVVLAHVRRGRVGRVGEPPIGADHEPARGALAVGQRRGDRRERAVRGHVVRRRGARGCLRHVQPTVRPELEPERRRGARGLHLRTVRAPVRPDDVGVDRLGSFSVTARMRPSGLKATSAPLAAELDRARVEFGMRTSVPAPVMRRAWIVFAPWLRTYTSEPLTATLTGRSPTPVTSTRCRPSPSISNRETSSLPALTASRSSPSAVIASDAWLPSPVGAMPVPPVATACSCVSVPSDARANATTRLPPASFVWTYM